MQLTVVGLGPGDPELVTVKGKRAIEEADVVFAPSSRIDRESRALRVAWPWLDPQRQQVVQLTLPMVRDDTQVATTYRAVAEEIAASLAPHQRGVYLLLGDPLLYGTFTYIWGELQTLLPALTVEIIPGVTSFAATAARIGMPLSMHEERVAVIPATEHTAADLPSLCERFETVILMKVGRVLPSIIDTIDRLNLLKNAVYAEYVGMPEEHIVHELDTLRTYHGGYLSLLIIRTQRGNYQ